LVITHHTRGGGGGEAKEYPICSLEALYHGTNTTTPWTGIYTHNDTEHTVTVEGVWSYEPWEKKGYQLYQAALARIHKTQILAAFGKSFTALNTVKCLHFPHLIKTGAQCKATKLSSQNLTKTWALELHEARKQVVEQLDRSTLVEDMKLFVPSMCTLVESTFGKVKIERMSFLEMKTAIRLETSQLRRDIVQIARAVGGWGVKILLYRPQVKTRRQTIEFDEYPYVVTHADELNQTNYHGCTI